MIGGVVGTFVGEQGHTAAGQSLAPFSSQYRIPTSLPPPSSTPPPAPPARKRGPGGLVTKHMGVRMCFLGQVSLLGHCSAVTITPLLHLPDSPTALTATQTVLCGLCGVYLLFVTESLPPSRRSTRSFNAMQVARLIIRDR